MRKLESMIAGFVEGLLQTIRDATVDDLDALFRDEPIQPRAASGRSRSAAAPSGAAAPARRTRRERRTVRETREESSQSRPPPTVAEITDPEALLSLSSPRPNGKGSSPHQLDFSERFGVPQRASQAVAKPESSPELDAPAPDSAVRPLAGGAHTIRLSENESVARFSNAGIVIRRRKKA